MPGDALNCRRSPVPINEAELGIPAGTGCVSVQMVKGGDDPGAQHLVARWFL